MFLALFDLDNTLIGGDSDYLWGEFVVEKGLVDEAEHRRQNDHFYQQYQAGNLDIHAYLNFSLAVLSQYTRNELNQWHRLFMREKITPILLPKAQALIQQHRAQQHRVVIITSTNRFVVEPIAEILEVDDLLATELEQQGYRYTGNIIGEPCFRQGKITHLQAWCEKNEISLNGAYFYSDSVNDLPLLEHIEHPVAVDPDNNLRELAQQRQWPIISLR